MSATSNSTHGMFEETVTPDEFAAAYSFSKRRVRQAVRESGLGYKCGRVRRLTQDDVEELLAKFKAQRLSPPDIATSASVAIAGRITASPVARAKALAIEMQRTQSSRKSKSTHSGSRRTVPASKSAD